MLQRLPEQDSHAGEGMEDDWRRAMILLQSCKDEELLDSMLPHSDLLLRLFHEEGIRVFDSVRIQDRCRCSVERARNILDIIPAEDRQGMVVNGKIEVTCEFCNRRYDFDAARIEEDVQSQKPVQEN